MGIHTGSADLRDGDYFGDTLNRCARLRGLAHGGQTLLSRTTYDAVRERPPDGAGFQPLGPHWVSGVGRPIDVYQLCHPLLANKFPPLRATRRPRAPRRRGATVVFPLSIVAILAGFVAFMASSNHPPPSIKLTTVPAGVSFRTIGDTGVFLSRQGPEVDAFSARSPKGKPIAWCPREAVFFAQSSGEVFHIEGSWVAGPARQSLDRLASAVEGDRLSVRTGRIRRGAEVVRYGGVGAATSRVARPACADHVP